MVISKIGVIGAGQMGHGIALVSAQAGFDVIIHDTTNDFVKKGIGKIEKFFDRSIEKGKMNVDEKKKIITKIIGTTKLDDLKNVDLIIEAIFENVQVKKQLFQELDKICKKECIFASNTSTIPITDLASVTNRSEKFIGMHFMNPVPLMKLRLS
jgi:3-hydroxybutyryl-CoA dehydrogenase